jgi:DNA-directed RNA polymerase subunit omega
MLYPSINDLLQKGDNRYTFVIAVAKRAREIANEAEEQAIILTEKPVKLAVQEFASGKCIMRVEGAQP